MDYTAALTSENQRLAEIIADADLTTPVPTCPEWTLLQLMRHVGRGHRWAAQMVTDRATEALNPREVRDGKPPNDLPGALDWFRASARAVIDAVAEAGPDTPVWTFIGPRPASWWVRRRLHEETVHRADAAIALNLDYQLSPELGADGVSEWLDIVAVRSRAGESPLEAGASVHLHATDEGLGTAGEWLVTGGAEGISWEPGHGKGSVALRGPSAELLLTITRRRSAEQAGLQVLGDEKVWTGWLERTPY